MIFDNSMKHLFCSFFLPLKIKILIKFHQINFDYEKNNLTEVIFLNDYLFIYKNILRYFLLTVRQTNKIIVIVKAFKSASQ